MSFFVFTCPGICYKNGFLKHSGSQKNQRSELFQKGFVVFLVRIMGDIYLRGEQRNWLPEISMNS